MTQTFFFHRKSYLIVLFAGLALILYVIGSIDEALADGNVTYLIGHVVSVDKQALEFFLAVDFDRDNRKALKSKSFPAINGHILVRLAPDSRRPNLPHCVRQGELVRAWGHIDKDNGSFMAVDIRGTRGWGRDASGVRSRIGRRRQFRLLPNAQN